MTLSNKTTKLSSNVRILLGLFSIPSLFLAYMIGTMALNGDYKEIDYFEWVYSIIGFLALYIAVTGKRFF